jgi:hypothetical protein
MVKVQTVEAAWVAHRNKSNIKQRDSGAEKQHWGFVTEHFADRWASYREYETCRSAWANLSSVALTPEIMALAGMSDDRSLGLEGNPSPQTLFDAWVHYANTHTIFNTPTLNNHAVYKAVNVIWKNVILNADWSVIVATLSSSKQ